MFKKFPKDAAVKEDLNLTVTATGVICVAKLEGIPGGSLGATHWNRG